MAALELIEKDLQELEGRAGLGCALESFVETKIVEELISNLENGSSDEPTLESSLENFVKIMDQYQEQPHLLDPHLDWMLASLITIARSPHLTRTVTHQSFKYLYYITKVRHYKVVVRHLPHEVADLEPVLGMLNNQDPLNKNAWEIQYMLLLWLSIIIIIPFHLSRLDSIPIGDGYQKKPLAARVMDEGLKYLSVSSETLQNAAAYLICKFVTRPDAVDSYLPEFIEGALQALEKCDKESVFKRGILFTLALIFKHGKREDLLQFVRPLLKRLLHSKFTKNNETVVRKSSVKLIQRLGLTFLKPRVASWRYQRGSRVLVTNLLPQPETNDRASESPKPEDEEDYDLPEELEEIIEQLLNGLKDVDEPVRFSAAKGIGRITGRLPKELADDVVKSVLELFNTHEGDDSWHGGCLALAELGRRGLLLPDHLNEVTNVILKALMYDQQRGHFSVGSRIRDSACYVCWAFARAFDPKDLSDYVGKIASALLCVMVFDREVKCRRAASAAFQENVGRQGTFPYGIDILTTVDYFAVSSITRSYTELSVFVAKFKDYTVPLISHLVERKVNHWDKNIRELTAQALHKLTFCDVKYMITNVIPNLLVLTERKNINERHGAILALGEITHGIRLKIEQENKSITEYIDEILLKSLKDVIFNLHESKYFQGLGAELTRQAACCYIQKLSMSKICITDINQLVLWERVLQENLSYEHQTVQKYAVDALTPFCDEYFNDAKHQKRLLESLLRHIKAQNKITRIGFALALGAMPKCMLTGYLNQVVQSLLQCTEIGEGESVKWVESRRAAIQSLAKITQTVGIEKDGNSRDVVNAEILDLIFTAFLKSLDDYTADHARGDIGVIVREAAISALHDIVKETTKTDIILVSEQLSTAIMINLAQQAQEKIDSARCHAATTFASLLHSDLPHIPNRDKLREIFDMGKCKEIDWNRPQETYPLFIQLLNFSAYSYHVLLGLVVSLGGNVAHVVKHSNAALTSYLKSCDTKTLQNFANIYLQIFNDHPRTARLSLPLICMTELLLISKGLSPLIEDESNDFPLKLFDCIRAKVMKSREFTKLIAAASVYCALLQSYKTVRDKVLGQLALYLCTDFPRVRRETAAKLYESFILYDDIIDDVTEVMEILSETNWDDKVEDLRPIRNRLCELMNIPTPKLIKKEK